MRGDFPILSYQLFKRQPSHCCVVALPAINQHGLTLRGQIKPSNYFIILKI